MTIKKFLLLLIIVPLVFFIQSCGKGAGSGYTSPGSGQGSPVYIKLKPSRYAAQTNGCIEFYAEVHDAQGELLANIPVTFTNLSDPFGQLLDRCGGTEINPPVVINTDGWGRARVTLYSTTPGFASVLAQTYIGEQPRDTKTVLFSFCSTYDCLVLAPTLHLDVDSEPPDGILNEAQDFVIFNPPPDPDDKANLWATVRNEYGFLIPYSAHLVWGSDHAEGAFIRTETWTNENGQATAQVEFTPGSLRGTETHVNIWAYSDNVSSFVLPFDIVTFFLQPVSIASIDVSANPSVVEPSGTSVITATVWLNTGDLAPDGVPVLFTSCLCEDPPDCTICNDSCGFVDPLSMTADGTGQATSNLIAPPFQGTCMVTARANGITGSVNVLVATELTVTPESIEVNGSVGGTATFTITGGVAPYTVISDSTNAALDPDPATVAASGDTFDVVVPAGTATGTVTYTIMDSTGATVEATVNISVDTLTVIPPAFTISVDGVTGGTATYTVYGGVPGYDIFVNSINPDVQPDTTTLANSGDSFNIVVPGTACPGSTTYTIRDQDGGTVTATLTITSIAPALTIVPPSDTICENDATCVALQDTTVFNIAGGIPPYTTTSNNTDVIPHPGTGAVLNIDATNNSISANTTVTLSTADGCGTTRTATVSVIDQ